MVAHIQETSAGAVVFRLEYGKAKFLLLHYPEGHWGFPKGHVEEGEDLLDTAFREIEEETGIRQLEFFSEFLEQIKYVYERDAKTCSKTVSFFIASTQEKDIRLSEEHTEARWLNFNEALSTLTFDDEKWLLCKANKQINKIY